MSAKNNKSNAYQQFLLESGRKERSYRRKERRYRDYRFYEDGKTELDCRDFCSRNTVLDKVEAREISQEIEIALDTLTETQRRRIKLYYFHGYNQSEIAVIEGASKQNIHKSIKQSLRKLKNLMKQG